MSGDQVTAANMYDGRWMFTRRVDPENHNGNQCEIIAVRTYDAYGAVLIVDWMAEREAGYPNLKKFEGGANWPDVANNERAAGWLGYLFEAATWDLLYGNGVRRPNHRAAFSLGKI